MIQLVVPNPNIACKPGWCLKYVRETFGVAAIEPSATAGWENAKFKHRDKIFPYAWVPLWFSLDTTPLGHVVLRAPDGRIYSTSTLQLTPYVHPNLDHLLAFYAKYKMNLTYLGWSEDISNMRVVMPETISVQSVEEVEMTGPSAIDIAKEVLSYPMNKLGGMEGSISLQGMVQWYDANLNGQNESQLAQNREIAALKEIVSQLAVKQGVVLDYDAIAEAVVNKTAKRIAE